MKRRISLLGLLFLTGCAFAQDVIISSGGVFGNPSSKVKIQKYSVTQAQVSVQDSFAGSFTGPLTIDKNDLYVDAAGTLQRIDLPGYIQVASQALSSVSALKASGNYLLAGTFQNGGDHLKILDRQTLNIIKSFPEISRNVSSISVLGDSAYITSSLKGKVDQYPPFGVYNDSIGYLDVVDLRSLSFVHSVVLGPNAAGASEMFFKNDMMYILNRMNYLAYSITVFNTKNNGFNTYSYNDYGLGSGSGIFSGNLYFTTSSGLKRIKLSDMSSDSTFLINGNFLRTAMDTINMRFYFTETDYSSYGKLWIYDFNKTLLDTFLIGISPEAMGIWYGSPNSVKSNIINSFDVFPNPFKDQLNINSDNDQVLELCDFMGRVVKNIKILKGYNRLNNEELSKGLYFIRNVKNNEIFKLIKL